MDTLPMVRSDEFVGWREFILGGNAIFTALSARTGQRYTFKVRHKEAQNGYKATYFVNLLTGPDNVSDYTYLGMLDPVAGAVKLTRASRYNADSAPVKAINWIIGKLWAGVDISNDCALNHAGRCCRCGRMLTTPDSVARGLGPECASRL